MRRRGTTRAAVGSAVVTLVAGILATASPGPAAAAPLGATGKTRVIVVDDDRVQCATADFTSIQEALDVASDGDRVRVCAGLYREAVVIDESVTLQGEVGAVASLDCLDPAPSALGDLDPSRFAVVQPPAGELFDGVPLVRIAADDVVVTGLALEGYTDSVVDTTEGVTLYDAAVSVANSWSRTRLHHNVFRLNTVGVELGASASRVDHNCFRDNDFAVANQRYELTSARIDDNATFRTRVLTWEIGWSYRKASMITVDHNLSHDLGVGVAGVDHADAVTISANTMTTRGRGVSVGVANTDLHILGNVITGLEPTGGTNGILVLPLNGGVPTAGLVVSDNHISNMRVTLGRGIAVTVNSRPVGAVITGNVLTGNVQGLTVAAGTQGATISANRATDNTGHGIWLQPGTSGNVLTDNVALRNGSPPAAADARDDNLPGAPGAAANQWIRTTCVTDLPTGAICTPPEDAGNGG